MWMVFAAFAFLVAHYFIIFQRAIKIKRWRRSLDLDMHENTYNKLYNDINGFVLSHQSRIGQDAPEYVYGEVDFESFIATVSLCHPTKSTIFYDLGSGTGKAVLACAIVFNVKVSCGIELFASLHNCANLQKKRLKQIEAYKGNASKIKLVHANLLEVDFKEASLLFINAGAFFGDIWTAMSQHIEQLKPGSSVISVSKALSSDLFITTKVVIIKMSWGITKAFIQERR